MTRVLIASSISTLAIAVLLGVGCSPDTEGLFSTGAGGGSGGGTTSTGGSGGATSTGGTGATGNSGASTGETTSSSSTTSSTGGGGATTTSSSSSTSGPTTSSSTGGGSCGDGACIPPETAVDCPQDCAAACAHDVCMSGGPLVAGCSACVTTVCQDDPFCCTSQWDDACVGEAQQLCGAACCGDGSCDASEACSSCPQDCGLCADCPHTVCFSGPALPLDACLDTCVEDVCAADPTCCGAEESYDADCFALALTLCPGPNPCVAAVCEQDPTCCTDGWTSACVALAVTSCSTTCACTHSLCQPGMALSPDCNPCVADVCVADPFCCQQSWDGVCVNEVASLCGVDCN